LTQPLALVQLLHTGTCQINLDEMLFDLDHPGHYFRRLRSVAITLPCVTGPYSGVNATLTLTSAAVRTKAPTAGYAPVSWSNMDTGAVNVATPAGNCSISTSHGQNDAGLFEVNLHDERWLPFEGQGAVSAWTLELDPCDNTFNFSTITDVILHLRYTARSMGGNPEAVRQALKPMGERQIMLSVKSSFSNAYYNFFNPSDASAAQQTLVLPLETDMLPFSNLGAPAIAAIALYLVLNEAPAAGTTISASFGPTGGTAGSLSIERVPGNTARGAMINALVGNMAFAGNVPPGSFTFTIPEGSVPSTLGVTSNGHQRLDAAKFDDIVLVITYQID
jgi:hypothetical protein